MHTAEKDSRAVSISCQRLDYTKVLYCMLCVCVWFLLLLLTSAFCWHIIACYVSLCFYRLLFLVSEERERKRGRQRKKRPEGSSHHKAWGKSLTERETVKRLLLFLAKERTREDVFPVFVFRLIHSLIHSPPGVSFSIVPESHTVLTIKVMTAAVYFLYHYLSSCYCCTCLPFDRQSFSCFVIMSWVCLLLHPSW